MKNSTNILLSFPRSGNTWLRYCVEYLTKLPTKGYGDYCLRDLYKFDYEINKNVNHALIKRHSISGNEDNGKNGLVLIVRNYKESIIRHFASSKDEISIDVLMDNLSGKASKIDYIALLLQYHNWSGPKHIIYYEDIINDLESVLDGLVKFLGVEHSDLKEFMNSIESHTETCVNAYDGRNGSFTKGKGTIFHSNKLTSEQKKQWDEAVKEKFPTIFENYLKRYEEQ